MQGSLSSGASEGQALLLVMINAVVCCHIGSGFALNVAEPLAPSREDLAGVRPLWAQVSQSITSVRVQCTDFTSGTK